MREDNAAQLSDGVAVDGQEEVQIKSDKEQTALRWATAKGHLLKAQQLLKDKNVGPDFKDEEAERPYHLLEGKSTA